MKEPDLLPNKPAASKVYDVRTRRQIKAAKVYTGKGVGTHTQSHSECINWAPKLLRNCLLAHDSEVRW